ncbi:MAG: phospholipase D-like domain-containing protein [Bacteroidota bacterium]
MQIEAVFYNIAERISQEISKAQKSIIIAVAWFTNERLFEELLSKAKSGCMVQLIISNDEINQSSRIEFERLQIKNSKVFKVGDGASELMHNKFCVIDHNTVITGSYNWSYKAENNFENIIITYDDTILAGQFISEFNNIRNLYFPNETSEELVFPLGNIIKRLEILKNYILLEDIEELKKNAQKLKEFEFNSDIHELIEEIRKEEFASAINKIQNFIAKNQALSVWNDPEIAALKLEIKNLENQLNAFDNERVGLEKMLSEFQHRHTMELGDIILEILKLRKQKFKENKTKYEEAEKDEKEYYEQVNEEKEKDIIEISYEQKAELKKKFRQATILCHPDKFVNESVEIQREAENIFKELNEANAKNDLNRVIEILSNLEKGILSTSLGDNLTDKEKLRSTINRLREKVKKSESIIIAIKQSDTYNTITSIDDWDEYFEQTKKKLEVELTKVKMWLAITAL